MADDKLLPGEIVNLGGTEETELWQLVAGRILYAAEGISSANASVTVDELRDMLDYGITGGSVVTSVNGQTGVVNLAATDIGAANEIHTHGSIDLPWFGSLLAGLQEQIDNIDVGTDGTPGTDGTSAYAYFGFASSTSGSDFTMLPDPTSAYIAPLATNAELTNPQASDFAGLWVKFKGDKGDPGEQGIQGIQGEPGLAGADGSDGVDGAPGTTLHSELTDVQGGATGERYHLTLMELESVQELGSASTYASPDISLAGHTHDGRYYTEGEIDTMLAALGSSGAVSSVNGQTGAVTLGAADVGATPATHTAATNPHGITAVYLGALEMLEVTALPATTAAAANVVYARNALGDWSDDADGFYKLLGSTFVEIGGV